MCRICEKYLKNKNEYVEIDLKDFVGEKFARDDCIYTVVGPKIKGEMNNQYWLDSPTYGGYWDFTKVEYNHFSKKLKLHYEYTSPVFTLVEE